MEKKQLSTLIDEVLLPLGFKKKGNIWTRDEELINKRVVLQKSSYGNSFYINYGYIINAISLDGHDMHIFNRLSSDNPQENMRIEELLNLDSETQQDVRMTELTSYLSKLLVRDMEQIKTENDLRNELQQREHINDILLIVKKHLKLI